MECFSKLLLSLYKCIGLIGSLHDNAVNGLLRTLKVAGSVTSLY